MSDLHVEVSLACGLSVSDALLENILGFFDELAVQINGVSIDPADGIIFPEDVVGRLFVVLVHHCAVSFPLF